MGEDVQETDVVSGSMYWYTCRWHCCLGKTDRMAMDADQECVFTKAALELPSSRHRSRAWLSG